MNITKANTTLNTIWRKIREHHIDVKDCTIRACYYPVEDCIVPVPMQWYKNGMLHINVADCTSIDILMTLLHEACHSIAKTNGVRDTSRYDRYHNKHFAKIADELGLLYDWGKDGCSVFDVDIVTSKRYKDLLDELDIIMGE